MNKEKIKKLEILLKISFDDQKNIINFIERCRTQIHFLIANNLMNKKEARDSLFLLKSIISDFEHNGKEIINTANDCIKKVDMILREVLV